MVMRFIYKLIDPITDTPFYVGQTKNIPTRLVRHISDSTKDVYPYHKRILGITKSGKTPIIETIEQVEYDPDQPQATDIVFEREKYWIDYYSKSYQLSNTEYNPNAVKIQRECLNCNEFYYPNKPRQKFCSDKCRVYYSRKKSTKKQKGVSTVQVQVLYNAVLEMVENMKQPGIAVAAVQKTPFQSPLVAPRVSQEDIMHKYVEDRREVSCEDEYVTWLKRLEADDRLTQKQKESVKETR